MFMQMYVVKLIKKICISSQNKAAILFFEIYTLWKIIFNSFIDKESKGFFNIKIRCTHKMLYVYIRICM